MAKGLKTIFRAKLARYNFSQMCWSVTKEYDHYPTEDELLEFLNEAGQKDDGDNMPSTITVEKAYRVVNTFEE